VAIWFAQPTVDGLNAMTRGTMTEHIGIVFDEIGEDFLAARMPVDARTRQPYGILHGGASAALVETLGSVASAHCVDSQRFRPAGIEINVNHVRAVAAGHVRGVCRPLHLGRTLHVWDIRSEDDGGRLNCVARLTVAILPAGPA
jgi:uncharacterized protein (TIGR00369 family)